MFRLAAVATWGLACAEGAGGADPASESLPEPEMLVELDGWSTQLRQDSDYVWWMRGGQLERVPKAGGAVEVVASGNTYTIADDSIYVEEWSSDFVTKYSLHGDVQGQVALVGGGSPLYCDALEARGPALYCANGRGVFRSIELSSDWLALGTSGEYQATGLAVSSSRVYWTTGSLQSVPVGGGATDAIGPANNSGMDMLGDSVFFGSNSGGLAGVYEYSESGGLGLVSRSSQPVRDVAVIESGFYELDVAGALRWHAFGSAAPRLLVEGNADPAVEDVAADATHVYYVDFSPGSSARSRILRRAHL